MTAVIASKCGMLEGLVARRASLASGVVPREMLGIATHERGICVIWNQAFQSIASGLYA